MHYYGRLRGARVAVFALFVYYGIVLATWAVHLPTVQQNTGVSTSLLATLLLILGAGALVGMQIGGVGVDRYRSGPVAVGAVSAMASVVVVPLAMTTWLAAAFAVFLFGLTTGAADVAMNAAAVDVERRYGRPIMAAFHAMFSVGNVIGSLMGAAGFAAGAGLVGTAGAVTAVCLVIIGCTATGLRRGWPGDTAASAPEETAPPIPAARQTPRRRILVLGVLAFLLLLAEGSAMDWSSLHAQKHLGASQALGAIAFGAFVGAMTIGRFTVDRLAARVGPVWVVRWGSVMAGAGLVLVMASPALPLTLVGWAIVGLGLAGGVPQVFTAAGNQADGSSGRTMSRVVGIGYLAILAGPAVIGWLADLVSLNTALIVPLCAAVFCAATAAAVDTRPKRYAMSSSPL